MFAREYGLVHNPGDSERYVRLVKWEGRWLAPDVDGYKTYSLVPVMWERTLLDISNPRLIAHDGPVWSWVSTAITELSMRYWPVVWPSDAPNETEAMRRLRIRELRRACHIDYGKGNAEPTWMWSRVPAMMHNPAHDVRVLAAA